VPGTLESTSKRLLSQQLRQLGDVRRNSPRLVLCEQLGRDPATPSTQNNWQDYPINGEAPMIDRKAADDYEEQIGALQLFFLP
jgi:hypothetical protein